MYEYKWDSTSIFELMEDKTSEGECLEYSKFWMDFNKNEKKNTYVQEK